MVETEVLLEEVVDDHGRIRVVEVGPYRFLEFGEEDAHQSIISGYFCF